jgi:deoxyadenosine/deoxycytidine kinase
MWEPRSRTWQHQKNGMQVEGEKNGMEGDYDVVQVISLEGGIGAGKSTVFENLKLERPSLCFLDEPVHMWERSGLLEAMYAGKVDKGCFQIAALVTRFAPLLKAVCEGHRIILTERSVQSDYEVFAKANLAADSNELAAYEMAHHALMSVMPKTKLHIVYLRADVPTLVGRIAARDRTAERTRTREEDDNRRSYLTQLHNLQEKFFDYPCVTRKIIDASLDAATVAQLVQSAVRQICPVKLE